MRPFKFTLIILFFICCFNAYSQNAENIHVVTKGETVASICSQYGISQSDLLKENPVLKNYIYVGMKIRIPSSASTKTENNAQQVKENNAQKNKEETDLKKGLNEGSQAQNEHRIEQPVELAKPSSQSSTTKEITNSSAEGEKNGTRWLFADKGGYYRNPDNGSNGFSMCFSIGAGYVLSKYLVLEGLIGYGSTYSYAKVSGYEAESNTSHLVLNQNIHFILPIGSFFGLGAFMGPEEQMFLTGTTTVNKEKNKMNPSQRLVVAYDIGARVYLGGFYVGAEYKIGLSKNSGSLWGISIGYLVNL